MSELSRKFKTLKFTICIKRDFISHEEGNKTYFYKVIGSYNIATP